MYIVGIAMVLVSVITFLFIAGITNYLSGKGGYDANKVKKYVSVDMILFLFGCTLSITGAILQQIA